MEVLLYSKEELAAFLIAKIRESEPSIRFEPRKGHDMLFNVRFDGSDGEQAVMNFDNIWTAYRRTNDLNCVIEGLNAQLKALRLSRDMKEDWQGFREEHVYPVLRPKRYSPVSRGGATNLSDSTVEGLDTLFYERRDGVCLFLNKELIPEGERNRWKRIAYDNVRKKGWAAPPETFPALNIWEGGMIHVFYGAEHPFHLQFFLKELREKEMPQPFLVGFPSYDMAIALTVENGIWSERSAKDIAIRSGLARYMHVMYFEEPRPLSVNVYWVKGDKNVCVYRQPQRAAAKKTGRSA